jgi:ribosomal protein L28
MEEETKKAGEKITNWTEARLSSLVGMNIPKKETEATLQADVVNSESTSSDDDFNKSLFAESPSSNATKKTLSSNPYAKFIGVALPLAGIFFFVGLVYTLMSGGFGNKKAQVAVTPTPTATPTSTADSETGNLKTEVALGTQAQQINALEESKKKSTLSATPIPTPTKISTPRQLTTSTISTTPQPPLIRTPPKLKEPTPATRSLSLPSRPRTMLAPQSRQQPIQYTKPRIASSIAPRIVPRTAPIQQQPRQGTPSTQKRFAKHAVATPLPQVYPTIPNNRNRYSQPPGREELASLLPPENQQNLLTQKQKLKTISYGSITYSKPSQSSQSNNTLLANNNLSNNSNSNFVANRLSEESQEINNLLRETNVLRFRAGSYAQGLLVTPVFYLDQKGNSAGNGLDNLTYALSLKEGLKGASGDIVIPALSLVIIKAISINSSGLVNLGVVSFIHNDREYPLPSEMFSVRGSNNKPLLASKINTGGNLTGAEIKEAVFASLAKVGDVLTRSDSTSTISSGGVSTTQTSGGKDIFGAVLSGGFNSILKRESDKTNRVIEANLSRPQLWYVEKGTKATLYVNKSFNL